MCICSLKIMTVLNCLNIVWLITALFVGCFLLNNMRCSCLGGGNWWKSPTSMTFIPPKVSVGSQVWFLRNPATADVASKTSVVVVMLTSSNTRYFKGSMFPLSWSLFFYQDFQSIHPFFQPWQYCKSWTSDLLSSPSSLVYSACYNSLCHNQTPIPSLASAFWLAMHPPQLSGLTIAKKLLIVRCKPGVFVLYWDKDKLVRDIDGTSCHDNLPSIKKNSPGHWCSWSHWYTCHLLGSL